MMLSRDADDNEKRDGRDQMMKGKGSMRELTPSSISGGKKTGQSTVWVTGIYEVKTPLMIAKS